MKSSLERQLEEAAKNKRRDIEIAEEVRSSIDEEAARQFVMEKLSDEAIMNELTNQDSGIDDMMWRAFIPIPSVCHALVDRGEYEGYRVTDSKNISSIISKKVNELDKKNRMNANITSYRKKFPESSNILGIRIEYDPKLEKKEISIRSWGDFISMGVVLCLGIQIPLVPFHLFGGEFISFIVGVGSIPAAFYGSYILTE